MRWYKDEQPERADQIAWKVYGSVDATEALIRSNPTIASMTIIPVGTLLRLPELQEPQKPQGVSLWS